MFSAQKLSIINIHYSSYQCCIQQLYQRELSHFVHQKLKFSAFSEVQMLSGAEEVRYLFLAISKPVILNRYFLSL